MENNFSIVSLGFAEFVSQLIHETFDAILDSQNYQIDKYLELEKALNTSNSEFAKKYLTISEINEYITDKIGFELIVNMILGDKEIVTLSNILSSIESNEVVKSKLIQFQYDLIYYHLLEILINEKKSKIRMFVERPELARLFVDSGEIKAKLNLYCLNEEIQTSSKESSEPTTMSRLKEESSPINEKVSFEVKKLDFSKISLVGKRTDVKASEIMDKTTGLKTILIDKESVKGNEINFNIPSARIIANPIHSNSSSAISSEVIIKFRSI